MNIKTSFTFDFNETKKDILPFFSRFTPIFHLVLSYADVANSMLKYEKFNHKSDETMKYVYNYM